MRLCLFTPMFLPAVGGTERVTDALAREFHAQGHHVVVLARGRDTPLDVPYPVAWFPKPLASHWFPERIGRHLLALHARERFDLIAVNYGLPTGYTAVRLRQRLGVPVVITSHGWDLYRTGKVRRQPHSWRRIQYAYRHADGLVAISAYLEELIREVVPQPRLLQRIPNGVDAAALTAPAPRPADFTDQRPFALCLGNLKLLKGFDDALAAFAQARDALGDLVLVLVGRGIDEERLRSQAAELGLGNRVRFLGERTGADKCWLLQNCRFGVAPSVEEGHPLVALEFLAVGKPLVCSTLAAFDGMYDEGINACRAPAREPAALAQALVRMHGADLAAMGAQSRRRAADYTWSAVAAQYLAFFERVRAAARSPMSPA